MLTSTLITCMLAAHQISGHAGKIDPFGGHWDHQEMTYHCQEDECLTAKERGEVPYEPVPGLLKRMRELGLNWRERYEGLWRRGTERPRLKSKKQPPSTRAVVVAAPNPTQKDSLGTRVNRHFETAAAAHKAGDLKKAETSFMAGITLAESEGLKDPAIGLTYYVVAKLRKSLERKSEEEQAYQKAIILLRQGGTNEERMRLASALNNLEFSRLERGEGQSSCLAATDEAIELAGDYLADQPGEIASFLDTRALCLSRNGQVAEAGLAYEMAVELLDRAKESRPGILNSYASFLATNGRRIESLKMRQRARVAESSREYVDQGRWPPVPWKN